MEKAGCKKGSTANSMTSDCLTPTPHGEGWSLFFTTTNADTSHSNPAISLHKSNGKTLDDSAQPPLPQNTHHERLLQIQDRRTHKKEQLQNYWTAQLKWNQNDPVLKILKGIFYVIQIYIIFFLVLFLMILVIYHYQILQPIMDIFYRDRILIYLSLHIQTKNSIYQLH